MTAPAHASIHGLQMTPTNGYLLTRLAAAYPNSACLKAMTTDGVSAQRTPLEAAMAAVTAGGAGLATRLIAGYRLSQCAAASPPKSNGRLAILAVTFTIWTVEQTALSVYGRGPAWRAGPQAGLHAVVTQNRERSRRSSGAANAHPSTKVSAAPTAESAAGPGKQLTRMAPMDQPHSADAKTGGLELSHRERK